MWMLATSSVITYDNTVNVYIELVYKQCRVCRILTNIDWLGADQYENYLVCVYRILSGHCRILEGSLSYRAAAI